MTKYVVIGAGWLGVRAVLAIESLSKDAEVTVLQIGSKDYVDINIGNPRLAVEPNMVEKAYQPLTKAWDRATLVHIQEIREVSSGKVVLIDSKGTETTLEADGIIVATGSVQSSSLMQDRYGKSKEERKAQFQAFRSAVENSKAGVLIVGGGATGVELSGEIGHDFPNVKCTLVNKPKLLLRGSAKRAKMHKIVKKQLIKLGVNVITDDSIENLKEDYMGEPKMYTTKKGVKIEADVVVMCVGGYPNVPFPAEGALGGLSVNGAMLCEKLGTDPSKPVWALGDCTNVGGRGTFADAQTAAFSASATHFETTGSTKAGPTKYKHKTSEQTTSLVSVGRRGGAISLPFPNKMLGKAMKSKDLGVTFIYQKEFKIKV